jgi:hypothetical protein
MQDEIVGFSSVVEFHPDGEGRHDGARIVDARSID